LKYAPTSVYDELIDKYSRLERTLSIRHENIPNAKRIKRMLLIGLPHNYLDSFKYFLEDDWEIYVIKAQNWDGIWTGLRIHGEHWCENN